MANKDYSILIGGKAGQGIAFTSYFLGRLFADLGYYVFNYRDYPSLIRGGHNFNVIRISEKPVYSHKENYDLIIALDEKTIDLHKKNLNSGGEIFRLKETKKILEKLKAPEIVGNNVLIGAVMKYFGVDGKLIQKRAGKIFKEKSDLVKKAIKEGYKLREKKENFRKAGKERYFISGNEGVAAGAVAAGIDVYIAYPMTPATPVLHWLAKRQLKYNILVLQLENEIAVVNAALGASYTGAKTMVGTSGGGFSLMAEALSLQGMSEVPLVVYLAQRPAPSTGVPTYTAQGDLKLALNAGQGEFLRVVVAPGDSKEAFLRTKEAFYLSSKYRVLSIILGDKHLGESNFSFDRLESSKISNSRFILENPPKNYQSYKITKNGVSPRAVPGQGPAVRATSYEHNEYGLTVEDPYWAQKMADKRFKKLPHLEKEIERLNPVSVYGKGENLLISWGSPKGAILDALPQLKNFRFLQISYLSPFPGEKVKKEISKSKKVILIENNTTGPLGDVIAEKTGNILKNKILKYDARPFTADYLVKKISKL